MKKGGIISMSIKVTRAPSRGGRPARIDEEMKNRIVTLYNGGKNGKEIAETVHVSKASVYRILKERR